MAREHVVRGIRTLQSFETALKRIKDPNLRTQICSTIQKMLFVEVDKLPTKLKFHQLKDKPVPSVLRPNVTVNAYTLHATPDDAYKVSFTFEDSTIYLRLVDEHDRIDRAP